MLADEEVAVVEGCCGEGYNGLASVLERAVGWWVLGSY
jgi:hypothetical protein